MGGGRGERGEGVARGFADADADGVHRLVFLLGVDLGGVGGGLEDWVLGYGSEAFLEWALFRS
jgi:hypothetical protein